MDTQTYMCKQTNKQNHYIKIRWGLANNLEQSDSNFISSRVVNNVKR